MRKQINPKNCGIIDYNPTNLNTSLTRRGYLHHSGTEFTENLMTESFGQWIRKLVGESFVVELGCGSAVISSYCKEYLGLDANRDAGNCCKGEFICVDLTAPYDFEPPVQADFLLSFYSLEHIEEELIGDLLQSADNLLKPGGKVFFVIDTQNLTEHLTIRNPEWWHEKLQRTGWIRDEITKEFSESYFESIPPHQKIPNASSYYMLFLYHKENK
jgi:SAM-dependent methyltransferase